MKTDLNRLHQQLLYPCSARQVGKTFAIAHKVVSQAIMGHETIICSISARNEAPYISRYFEQICKEQNCNFQVISALEFIIDKSTVKFVLPSTNLDRYEGLLINMTKNAV